MIVGEGLVLIEVDSLCSLINVLFVENSTTTAQ